jgi:hypothetical protein
MINYKTITQAIQTLLEDNTTGYIITRNTERNTDASNAVSDGDTQKGWIGIYKGPLEYEPHSTVKWLATINPKIEIQVAHYDSETAEDYLQDAEKEIMDILTANKKLGGTVNNTVGYSIDYEVNEDEEIYHNAAIITIKAEVTTT